VSKEKLHWLLRYLELIDPNPDQNKYEKEMIKLILLDEEEDADG